MQNTTSSTCPLCNKPGNIFHQIKRKSYYRCTNCLGIFVDPEKRPDSKEEKIRYEEHNNDIEDKGYQQFVSPITSAIMSNYSKNDKGLDFGAGTGPVISKVLNDNNYQIVLYDPFFHNYSELLETKYDYIACCEVIEHFHNPKKEFKLLKSLLNKNGSLYCMTDIYDENTTLKNWYYLNDPTHVFIFHEKTIHWVKEAFGFSNVTIEGRLISFSV